MPSKQGGRRMGNRIVGVGGDDMVSVRIGVNRKSDKKVKGGEKEDQIKVKNIQ